MELKVYGHDGKAILVFPSAGGKFYEYEDFDMVEACQPFIDTGRIKLFTVDSIDDQTWLNYGIHPDERARRHDEYARYIIHEVIPFIRSHGTLYKKMMVTGCNMGATHAANFFFKHPNIFDTVVALSGVYGSKSFLDDFMDDQTYFHFPLIYLPNLNDPWYLEQYRQSHIIFCVGQGAWEHESLPDTRAIKALLEEKDIPAWVDFWGYDVNHDWPWWQKQIAYFLEHLTFTR
jgi:esterase/lipase superfamily enzyme